MDDLEIEPLESSRHDRAAFSCDVESLDLYIRELAPREQQRGLATCYVLRERGGSRIVGYYTLSAASVELTSVQASRLSRTKSRRLGPYDRVPAALIGRLAVDSRYRGRGFGAVLLFDALQRIRDTSKQLGIAVAVVDALDETAVRFYEKYGFIRLGGANSMSLFLPLAQP